MWAVTLKQLRTHNACVEGYNKVVCMLTGKEFDPTEIEYLPHKHKAPISLIDIAKNNGISDALWATRCLDGKDIDLRLFAVWCARQVDHLMVESRFMDAIDIAEHFAYGDASKQELERASNSAYDMSYQYGMRFTASEVAHLSARETADPDAWNAAWGAAEYAARAARKAGNKESQRAVRKAQRKMFKRMCRGMAPW